MGVMRKLRRKSNRAQYEVEPVRPSETFPCKKISEVIQDFAEPLLNVADDAETFKNIIAFATICWNLSFFPENKQRAQLNAIVDELGKPDMLTRLEANDCALMLLERKKAFFADDRRMIVNYEIIDEGDSHRLLVVSVLAKD